MAVHRIFALLATVGCFSVVNTHPSGAPDAVCESMTPDASSHGPNPQVSTAPYTVNISSSTYIPNGMITVTLSGSDNANFKGVFVQARLKSGSSTDPQGTFVLNNGENELKLITCNSVEGSAVTHSSREDKPSKTVTWKAPPTNVGDVRFMATFVQDRATFWVGVLSSDVVGTGSQTDQTSTAGGSSTTQMSTTPDSGSRVGGNHGIFLLALIASTGLLQMVL